MRPVFVQIVADSIVFCKLFSIIIPVYNRPEEIDDLLNSLTRQTYVHFEVIVVDDGSSIPCEPVVNAYNDRLRIRYFYIENSGPGLARNQQGAFFFFRYTESGQLLDDFFLYDRRDPRKPETFGYILSSEF